MDRLVDLVGLDHAGLLNWSIISSTVTAALPLAARVVVVLRGEQLQYPTPPTRPDSAGRAYDVSANRITHLSALRSSRARCNGLTPGLPRAMDGIGRMGVVHRRAVSGAPRCGPCVHGLSRVRGSTSSIRVGRPERGRAGGPPGPRDRMSADLPRRGRARPSYGCADRQVGADPTRLLCALEKSAMRPIS